MKRYNDEYEECKKWIITIISLLAEFIGLQPKQLGIKWILRAGQQQTRRSWGQEELVFTDCSRWPCTLYKAEREQRLRKVTQTSNCFLPPLPSSFPPRTANPSWHIHSPCCCPISPLHFTGPRIFPSVISHSPPSSIKHRDDGFHTLQPNGPHTVSMPDLTLHGLSPWARPSAEDGGNLHFSALHLKIYYWSPNHSSYSLWRAMSVSKGGMQSWLWCIIGPTTLLCYSLNQSILEQRGHFLFY